jgi:hypothetical protein
MAELEGYGEIRKNLEGTEGCSKLGLKINVSR